MNRSLHIRPEGIGWVEVPVPVLTDTHEAIVRPLAVTLCDIDLRLLAGEFPIQEPAPLGHEAVAEVLEAGEESGVQRGDIVSVSWMIACGRCDRCASELRTSCRAVPRGAMFGMPGQPWGGLLSDMVKVPYARAMLTLVPSALPPQTFVGLSCNLPIVCHAIAPHVGSDPHEPVLIVGGRGGLGLYAVSMAFALGARNVDYIDAHGHGHSVARALGARVLPSPPSRTGEYALAVVASTDPAVLVAALRALRPEGACEVVGALRVPAELPLADMYFRGVTLRLSRNASQESTLRAFELAALGALKIDTIQGEALPWESLLDGPTLTAPKPVFVRARSVATSSPSGGRTSHP